MAAHIDLSVIAIVVHHPLIGIVKKNGIMLVDFALHVGQQGDDGGGSDLPRLHLAFPTHSHDHDGRPCRRRSDSSAPAQAPRYASRWANAIVGGLAVSKPHAVYDTGGLYLPRQAAGLVVRQEKPAIDGSSANTDAG